MQKNTWVNLIHKLKTQKLLYNFHLNKKQYTFFSTTYQNFSINDHILGQKVSFISYKETEIKLCFLFEYHLEKLNNKNKKNRKLTNACKLYHSLNLKMSILKFWEKLCFQNWVEMKTKYTPKLMGHTEGSSKKQVHSIK